jgi:hypothetical protein
MPLADAIAFAREAASIDYLRGIAITGGEPFLEYEALQAILSEVGAGSLKAQITTNCYWATDMRQAHEMLAPLVKRGLTGLGLSYDEVHREFIPGHQVTAAARAALDLGLKVVIHTATLDGDIQKHLQQVQTDLALPPHENLYALPGYIVPTGRAARSFSNGSFCRVGQGAASSKRLRGPCRRVIQESIITPSGDLAACCSPSIATRTGCIDSFVIGNWKAQPLRDLLDALENDVIFNLLVIEGPWALYRLIQEHAPAAMPSNRFVNACDLCANILSNPSARSVLRDCLRGRGAEIAAKKLYLEALVSGDPDFLDLNPGVVRLGAAPNAS